MGGAAPAEVVATGEAPTEALLGEPRWPPVAAVVIFMALNIALRLWLPQDAAIRVPWLLPAIEAVLLVVLITSDPSGSPSAGGCIASPLALVGLLVAAALWATRSSSTT